MYNTSVYYPYRSYYPSYGYSSYYNSYHYPKVKKKKCQPGAITYYKGVSYKPAPHIYDPASWVIRPPIHYKKYKCYRKPSAITYYKFEHCFY